MQFAERTELGHRVLAFLVLPPVPAIAGERFGRAFWVSVALHTAAGMSFALATQALQIQ